MLLKNIMGILSATLAALLSYGNLPATAFVVLS